MRTLGKWVQQKTAIFWIRDGVLVDRMHINPVAFAVAALCHGDARVTGQTSLTELINFGFATSGISCAEKMRRFNEMFEAGETPALPGLEAPARRVPLVADVSRAADYYNTLATEAAKHCSYFEGACDLVRHMGRQGVLNFITSAVEQSVLDAWAESPQGAQLAPHLTAILGSAPNFKKGKDHFAFVRENYGVERFFYVADAVSEIRTGGQLAPQFNISPIGFAYVIDTEKVRLAHDLVLAAHQKLWSGAVSANLELIEAQLSLPGHNALVKMLQDAKATHVVEGDATSIMGVLFSYFQSCCKPLL